LACPWDGKSRWESCLAGIGSAILLAGLLSCGGPRGNQPLNPRILFSTGSRFLHEASTLAIKGSIEFDSGVAIESGSFQLFINGPDSISFLIEGPFKVDVFRLVIADDLASAYSRAEGEWYGFKRGELLDIPEYGIEKMTPFLLGTYILPQYYLRPAGSADAPITLVSPSDNVEFHIESGTPERSFLLSRGNADIIAVYSRRKNHGDGFYPSQVEIFDKTESWRISLEIDKIRINPSIPAKLWLRDR
jgi:hypothetical protein